MTATKHKRITGMTLKDCPEPPEHCQCGHTADMHYSFQNARGCRGNAQACTCEAFQ